MGSKVRELVEGCNSWLGEKYTGYCSESVLVQNVEAEFLFPLLRRPCSLLEIRSQFRYDQKVVVSCLLFLLENALGSLVIYFF